MVAFAHKQLWESISDQLRDEILGGRLAAGSRLLETELAERFPLFRDRLKGRLPTINQVSREQVELLARYRAETDEDRREAVKSALLLSINCIAVGFGATG